MTRLLIIFGLATLAAILGGAALPDWLVIAGGASAGGATSWRLFTTIERRHQ